MSKLTSIWKAKSALTELSRVLLDRLVVLFRVHKLRYIHGNGPAIFNERSAAPLWELWMHQRQLSAEQLRAPRDLASELVGPY